MKSCAGIVLLSLLAFVFFGRAQATLRGKTDVKGTGNFTSYSCSNITFIDFEGGTDGNTNSAATLLASTHGLSGTWSLANACTWPFFDDVGQQSLLNPISICTNGLTYSGAGTLGFRTDFSLSPTNAVIFQLPNPVPSDVSVGFWWRTDLPNNAVLTCDWMLLQGVNNTDFNNPELSGNGGLRILMEKKGVACPVAQINVTNNTWYWFTLCFGPAKGQSVWVYSTAGVKLGAIDCTNSLVGFTNLHLGLASGSGTGMTNNSHIWIDSIKADFVNGAFPLLP